MEKVLDGRLDKLFEEYVAKPLGMISSTYCPDRSGDIVNGNLSPDEVGIVSDFNCRFLDGIAGNAGVFSNVQDLTRYVNMLLHYGAPWFEKRLSIWRLKIIPKTSPNPEGWGLYMWTKNIPKLTLSSRTAVLAIADILANPFLLICKVASMLSFFLTPLFLLFVNMVKNITMR